MFQVLRFHPLERIQQSGSTTKDPLPKEDSIQGVNSSKKHFPQKELNLLGNFHLPSREKNRTPHHGWVGKEIE